jgi:O-acetyl-ADP-ribose deacetylase (regulator of RNase III)
MKVKVGGTVFSIERGDITEVEVDAIVNAANAALSMGTGVAGAMKRKGGTVIEEEAIRQGPIEPGEAVITVAGNLPATHVIHAAALGPDLKTNPERVAAATRSSLALAERHKISSIAFPALGSGTGGVAPGQSAEAMVSTVVEHVRKGNTSLQKVMFVLYQDEAFKAFSDALKRLAGTA